MTAPGATAVVLVRHGETHANRDGRVQGTLDPPLTGRGHAQAREVAARLGPLGAVRLVASPARRARQTAEAIACELGLAVELDARFAESDRGRWEGRLIDEIARAEPERWASYRAAGSQFRFPGGESLAEHAARARRALAEVLAGPRPTVVVCHGGTIRSLLGGPEDFHVHEVPNGALFCLDHRGDRVGA